MSRRMKTIQTLAEFFAEQGILPDAKTYNKMKGRPIHIARVRRIVGPWGRVLSWVEKYYPELAEQARTGQSIEDEVAAAREAAEAEAAAAVKAAEDAEIARAAKADRQAAVKAAAEAAAKVTGESNE